MEPHREQRGLCPFHHSDSDIIIELPKSDLSPIESLRSQVGALGLSYQHLGLSRIIHHLETTGDCPVKNDRTLLNQEAAHLPFVSAAISILFEKMYQDFVDWKTSVSCNEKELPLIVHYSLDEPAIALTLQETMERIQECATLETQTTALKNLMESTGAFFFGPHGCYGPEAQALFSDNERKTLRYLLDAPKYAFHSTDLTEYEYLNSIIQAGLRTGVRVLTKLAVITHQLLSQQLSRSPTPSEFQACFLASQEFSVDMMRLPLGIAERIDHALNRDEGASKIELGFYDSSHFALAREEKLFTVGLKTGTIASFSEFLGSAISPLTGRSGLDFSTGCPALYASANGNALIRDLADWVGSLFSKTVLTLHNMP